MNARKQALTKISEAPQTFENLETPYDINSQYGVDTFGLRTMEA